MPHAFDFNGHIQPDGIGLENLTNLLFLSILQAKIGAILAIFHV